MGPSNPVNRRDFLNQSMAVAGTAGVLSGTMAAGAPPQGAAAGKTPARDTPAEVTALPCGTLGRAKVSRLLLGGNLIGGYMHCRDLKYVNSLFRAYATEEKILETLALAEQHGINTVFETGGDFVQVQPAAQRPHAVHPPYRDQDELEPARASRPHQAAGRHRGGRVYVWGVSSDPLIRDGQVDVLARAVEMAKKHGLPVGVGCHSLQVPMQCEKHGVPCDFYVKTLHSDDYFSATPKELRKEFIWLDGGKGWDDNMWCINPEETIAFMKRSPSPGSPSRSWRRGPSRRARHFPMPSRTGPISSPSACSTSRSRPMLQLAERAIRHHQKRERPWRA